MMNTPGSPRQQGVRLPAHQTNENSQKGEPRTVLGMAVIEQYAVNIVDEEGTVRNTVLIMVGGKPFIPKNAEPWLAELRPAAQWLADQAQTRLDARKASTNTAPEPTTELPGDTVDVIPEGTK